MAKKDILVLSMEAQSELSLDELCEVCHVTQAYIHELVEYGTIEPRGVSLEMWRFTPYHIRRIQTVKRLQQDLDVNVPGAALAVDLLEQIDRMRVQLQLLEKHLSVGRKG